jgi:hypothetical protein
MSWNVELTLLKYRNEWYQTTDDIHRGRTLMQYFDSVVEVSGDKFNIIKDRESGITGLGEFGALLRMKLFTLGITFRDLPRFTKHPAYIPADTVIGYKDNGELFEYPEPTRTL